MIEKKSHFLNRQLPKELLPAIAKILPGASIDSLRRGVGEDGQTTLAVRISAPAAPSDEDLNGIAKAAREHFEARFPSKSTRLWCPKSPPSDRLFEANPETEHMEARV